MSDQTTGLLLVNYGSHSANLEKYPMESKRG